jgi:WXG100 family type VII secretion target
MRVTVHHDAVADTVAKLALTVKSFEHELEKHYAEVRRVQEAWDGDAQRSYERAQREWRSAIESMKGLLAEATRRLITANSISMATASRAADVWA